MAAGSGLVTFSRKHGNLDGVVVTFFVMVVAAGLLRLRMVGVPFGWPAPGIPRWPGRDRS
ncbi:hypothetical protein JL106_15950 [Nakamurella sp. YIM 132084]|uniref:Uncharacterized protein n=1 Tax=Nakamurella leprariae TaxID=2803911 RepID=A0A939C359_9ACTN|nr:hypothetical protein [Nakamurella leprariae]MBM9468777.1 hypothetical protein [Nakamurella leprariae]